MTRRQIVAASAVAAVLIAAVVGLWLFNRRQAIERASPAWLDPQQPPEGVAGRLTTLTPMESWAANRCRPMAASCGNQTAGRRVRRTYAPTLAADANSVVC